MDIRNNTITFKSLNRNNNKCAHIIHIQAKNYVKYCSSKYEMKKWTFVFNYYYYYY